MSGATYLSPEDGYYRLDVAAIGLDVGSLLVDLDDVAALCVALESSSYSPLHEVAEQLRDELRAAETVEYFDALATWRGNVANGSTVLGFDAWCHECSYLVYPPNGTTHRAERVTS